MCLFQCSDLSNPLLRTFDSFCLSFVHKVTAGTCDFVFWMVKIILLELESSLSLPPVAKTQCFLHSSFNLTLQLMNDFSIDLQMLLRYFNGKAIVCVF